VHNRGIVLCALVATLAIVALSGCSALSTNAASAGLGTEDGAAIAREALGSPTTVGTGQCWELTYQQFLQEPDESLGVRVDCSAKHQAYTFVVATVDASVQRADAAHEADNR